jgi:hypothetical protein
LASNRRARSARDELEASGRAVLNMRFMVTPLDEGGG